MGWQLRRRASPNVQRRRCESAGPNAATLPAIAPRLGAWSARRCGLPRRDARLAPRIETPPLSLLVTIWIPWLQKKKGSGRALLNIQILDPDICCKRHRRLLHLSGLNWVVVFASTAKHRDKLRHTQPLPQILKNSNKPYRTVKHQKKNISKSRFDSSLVRIHEDFKAVPGGRFLTFGAGMQSKPPFKVARRCWLRIPHHDVLGLVWALQGGPGGNYEPGAGFHRAAYQEAFAALGNSSTKCGKAAPLRMMPALQCTTSGDFIESLLLPRLLGSAGEGTVNKQTPLTFNHPYEAQYETHSLCLGIPG